MYGETTQFSNKVVSAHPSAAHSASFDHLLLLSESDGATQGFIFHSIHSRVVQSRANLLGGGPPWVCQEGAVAGVDEGESVLVSRLMGYVEDVCFSVN